MTRVCFHMDGRIFEMLTYLFRWKNDKQFKINVLSNVLFKRNLASNMASYQTCLLYLDIHTFIHSL